MANNNRLGELLVREKLISLTQLRHAQDEQQKSGNNLGYTLAKLGYVSDDEITSFLSQQYRVPTINLEEYEIDADVLKLVPKEPCERAQGRPGLAHGQLAHRRDGGPDEPQRDRRPQVPHRLQHRAGHRERDRDPRGDREVLQRRPLVRRGAWPASTKPRSSSPATRTTINLLELEKASEDAPVVRLVNMMLLNAIKKGASDIHIEPYEKKFRVRYRIDGVLAEEMTPPLKLKNAIISRIKIMASLDIAERRLPQDGRIKLKLGKGTRDGLPRLGAADALGREGRHAAARQGQPAARHDQARLRRRSRSRTSSGPSTSPGAWCSSPGPTGSGKTTTLYSALSELNKIAHNISTAEDPVEYNLHGINQVQMHDEIGLNFAMALRAFLRQDPDIIMVGEIRDFETAEIAVKAALTGHMVLSTLHTNDAPGDDLAPPQHGRRAVPHHGEREPRARPAPRAQDLRRLQAAASKYEKQVLEDCGFSPEQIAQRASS